MNELENCPFCGEPNPSVWKCEWGWRVKCVNGCSVSIGGYDSREGAVRAWNRRPRPEDDGDDPQVAYIEALHVDLAQLQAEVEQLRAELDEYKQRDKAMDDLINTLERLNFEERRGCEETAEYWDGREVDDAD